MRVSRSFLLLLVLGVSPLQLNAQTYHLPEYTRPSIDKSSLPEKSYFDSWEVDNDDPQINCLREIYDDTGGEDWVYAGGVSVGMVWFQKPRHFCTWIGVHCAQTGGIVSLSMHDFGMIGDLPMCFSAMEALLDVNMYGNQLNSAVAALSGAPMIEVINLSNNMLTEDFPNHALSNAHKLKSLDVSYNFMTGSISNEFFQGVSELTHLDLASNDLHGSLGGARLLEQLRYLDVAHNEMTGILPECLSHLPSITFLCVRSNRFSGELPEWLSDLPSSLRVLSMGGNSFEGPVPSLTELKGLKDLDLSGIPGTSSGLQGPWPENFPSSIVMLDLGFNRFSGPLPDAWGNLPNLHTLRLSHNHIEQPLLTNWPRALRLVAMDGCGLTTSCQVALGVLPSSVLAVSASHNAFVDCPLNNVNMDELTMLNLAANGLTGTLPQNIWHLPSLSVLDLSDNQLHGYIPETLDQASLRELRLHGNNLHHGTSGRRILPDFLTPEFSQLIPGPPNSYCPRLGGVYHYMEVTLDASYYDYNFCSCNDGHWGPADDCRPCPEHAHCEFGKFHPEANPGYYPAGLTETGEWPLDPVLVECPHHIEDMVEGAPCNPRSAESYECGTGYEGRLCSRCSPGYYLNGRRCNECTQWATISLPIVYGLGFIMLMIYLIRVPAKKSGPLKIVLFHYQTTAVLVATAIPWNSYFYEWIMKSSSPTNFSLHSQECLLPALEFPGTALMAMATPFMFLVWAIVVYYFGKWWKGADVSVSRIEKAELIASQARVAGPDAAKATKNALTTLRPRGGSIAEAAQVYRADGGSRRSSVASTGPDGTPDLPDTSGEADKGLQDLWFHKSVYVFMFMVYGSYFNLSRTVLALFSCSLKDPATGLWYLNAVPWYECGVGNKDWLTLVAIGLFGIVYVLGVPWIVYKSVVNYRHRLDHPAIQTSLGFLYLSYRPKFYWWELLTVLRRFALAVTVTLVPYTAPAVVSMCLFLVLQMAGLAQVRCSPYHSKLENRMEVVSLATLIASFFCGLVMFQSGNSESFILSILMLAGHLGVALYFFLVLVAVYAELAWNKVSSWVGVSEIGDTVHHPADLGEVPQMPHLPQMPKMSMKPAKGKVSNFFGRLASVVAPGHKRDHPYSPTPPDGLKPADADATTPLLPQGGEDGGEDSKNGGGSRRGSRRRGKKGSRRRSSRRKGASSSLGVGGDGTVVDGTSGIE